MTPIKCEIEIIMTRKKNLAKKYCQKNDPDSCTLQNVFRSLEKNGLLLQTSKNKHITCSQCCYSVHMSFTDSYTFLNLDYLELDLEPA